MTLFVDKSIWYAAADSSDRSNARANGILRSGGSLVTSDHVLVETWTRLRHKLQRNAAERFWDGLRNGVAIIEAVGLADLEVAWEIGNSWRDQDFSIVDRTSFAVMRRLGIDHVASFGRTLLRISLRSQTPPVLQRSSIEGSPLLESRSNRLESLEAEFIRAELSGQGRRKELLNEWVTYCPSNLRPTLHARRYQADPK
jgi:predicted nucleic acid-binding protein